MTKRAPILRTHRRRLPVVVTAAAVVVGIAALCAVLGSMIAPYDPTVDDLRSAMLPPSAQHWLGTDDSGRDVLSRVIVGARLAVLGPVVVVLGAALLGTAIGLLSGYRGGMVDAVIMRATDVLSALPALLVAVVLTGVLGGGYAVAVLVTLILTVAVDLRVVRGATLEVRPKAYVAAAETLGIGPARTVFRHILPNVTGIIVANMFLNLAHVLVVLAGLSFLGLGIPPGAPDWGRMLAENLPLIQQAPLAAIAPGIALVMFAVSANILGDGLLERLTREERS